MAEQKAKIYLEPRNKFDICICSESDIDITYNVQEIIAMLKDDFYNKDEHADEDDAIIEAIEYFLITIIYSFIMIRSFNGFFK